MARQGTRQGFFSPFPHGTGALSVGREYLALGGGPPRFTQDSSCPALLGRWSQGDGSVFAYAALTLSGWPFQDHSANRPFCNSPTVLPHGPDHSRNPSRATPAGFDTLEVWAVPRSLAATRGIAATGLSIGDAHRGRWVCFLFLRVLRWFTSPGVASPCYGFTR